MISIIGIGNAASRIAEKFSDTSSYSVYTLNSSIKRNSKFKHKLKTFDEPELYESNIPDLKKFFLNAEKHVQVFMVGSSFSSNYSLGILEQIKNKKIDLFYIKPDSELLTGIPKLVEKVVFGVLQEYARSGLLNSMTIISNLEIEKSLDNVPIKSYYDSINESIFSMVHYLNYFQHTETEIGMLSKPIDINRIRTIGAISPKTLEEKWFFELDTPRDVCYYICINKERLETDGTLHRKLVEILKKKPRNSFQRISYAIYETPYNDDFGFCVAHTNVVQKNT